MRICLHHGAMLDTELLMVFSFFLFYRLIKSYASVTYVEHF